MLPSNGCLMGFLTGYLKGGPTLDSPNALRAVKAALHATALILPPSAHPPSCSHRVFTSGLHIGSSHRVFTSDLHIGSSHRVRAIVVVVAAAVVVRWAASMRRWRGSK